MFVSFSWIIVSMLWLYVTGNPKELCPSEQSIAPFCQCQDFFAVKGMICSNVTNPEELIPPISATDLLDIFMLVINGSTFTYIPSTVFIDTNYKWIVFNNSQIMALSETDLAFEGLEDTLKHLYIEDVQYVTTWDWSQLRKLHKLELISINSSLIYSVEQRFPSWPRLYRLHIHRGAISFIHPEAFRGLKELVFIALDHNAITEMKREMFADPASNLNGIDLSHNFLESFSDDMFTNMPRLKSLYLNDNKLLSLKKEVFQWTLGHLALLNLSGNAIRCDCRLDWIEKTRKPRQFDGSCDTPAYLKDVPLKNLNRKTLICLQGIQQN